MPRRFICLLVSTLALLAPLSAQLPQQPPDDSVAANAWIMGRVVDAASGKAIPSAIVSLTGPGLTPQNTPRVLTTSDGLFLFRNLRGKRSYSVSVTKAGYVDGAYGRRRPLGPSQQIELGDGEKKADVTVMAWKYGTIGGTLTDEAGEPLVNVSVRGYRRTVSAGRSGFSMSGATSTDDRGFYRLGNLIPGDYLVVVESSTGTTPTSAFDAVTAASEKNDAARAALAREMMTAGAISASSPNTQQVGKFVISAGTGGRGGITFAGALNPIINGDRVFVYPTTFYPAAPSSAQAQPIPLRSGEERINIDIQLKPVATARVSGTLIGPDGPVTFTAVRLTVGSPEESLKAVLTEMDVATSVSDGTGAFTFFGVPPGQYVLRVAKTPPITSNAATTIVQSGSTTMVTSFSSADAVPAPLPSDPGAWAMEPISVNARDVTDLVVNLQPGLRISGHVEYDGTAPRPDPNVFRRITMLIEPANGSATNFNQRGQFESSGQFSTTGLQPGRYYLRLLGAPPGWIFKSATYDGKDLADVPLDLTSDVSGVVITFSDRPTELAGTVRGGGGGPDPDATVIVFPTEPAAWALTGVSPRRLRTVRTTPAGTYKIALPPGDYYIVAMPDESLADWADPRVLEGLSRDAIPQRLDDGEKKTVDLRTRQVSR